MGQVLYQQQRPLLCVLSFRSVGVGSNINQTFTFYLHSMGGARILNTNQQGVASHDAIDDRSICNDIDKFGSLACGALER
jgi:hypothetical protein